MAYRREVNMTPEQIRHHFPKHVAEEMMSPVVEQQKSYFKDWLWYAFTVGSMQEKGLTKEELYVQFSKWFETSPSAQEELRRMEIGT
jgi:hypothetical protein